MKIKYLLCIIMRVCQPINEHRRYFNGHKSLALLYYTLFKDKIIVEFEEILILRLKCPVDNFI